MSVLDVMPQAIADEDMGAHVVKELPVLVLLPHSRCNCRCVMCDIWKIRQVHEITAADLEPHLASFRTLKVRWVVFSGGEPLLHSDLYTLAGMLRSEGMRTTILTAGLNLARHARQVAENVDDVIVSLDGPREVHDRIRGVPDAFGRLARGLSALREHRVSIPIHGRCTIQKQNFLHLRATVEAARELKLESISFLAADITSEAFNHSPAWSEAGVTQVSLSTTESDALTEEIEALIADCQADIRSGFIKEGPEKFRQIGLHFRALLGQATHVAPRCNAPWVSAVIESDGTVRPCFFHRPFGRIQDGTLTDILNSEAALRFRSQLDVSTDRVCQRCVCSLFLPGQARA